MPSPSLTLLRTQSDERLVELARAGHERAFEAMVDRYRRPLLRAARRVLPEGRAEDALQQALLSAWTALQRGDEVRELRPWLYRIVHNTALNALRVSGYDYAELHEAVRIADAGDDELERRAVVRQTLASLAALPERQREALLRTAVSGESHEEVARDLGLSGNALRQLVHRARVSVRSAATALTPMPLVTAAASGASGGGPLTERISELVAGGGASVTLAKAGTVAVLAGSAISGPAIVHKVADGPVAPPPVAEAAAAPKHAKRSAAAAEPEPARKAPALRVSARVTPTATPSPRRRVWRPAAPAPSATRTPVRHHVESDEDVSVRREESGHDGSDDSVSNHEGSGHDDELSSGSGSGSGSGEAESGRDGESSGSGGEHSGERHEESPSPTPTPIPLASSTPTPEPDED
jgi:RNA polymerase sigma factor (sigma-70 family)